MGPIHFRWKIALVFAVLCAGTVGLPVRGASFDCAKASINVEKIICGDNELSRLDERLAELYKKSLVESIDRKAIRKSERTWIEARNECKDRVCVHRAYVRRINLLSEALKGSKRQTQEGFKYRLVNGSGQPLCDNLASRMNEQMNKRKPGGELCGYDVLRSIPGIIFPDWKKIEIKNNKALYERFVLAKLVRAEFYSRIFRETNTNNFIIQMPTKEQMTWQRERMHTKPGAFMDKKLLDLAWQEAVVKGIKLYEVDGVFSGRSKNDVLLIEMSTIDRYHLSDSCPHFRFVRFSAGLGYPKPLYTGVSRWTTQPMGFPFEYGGEKMVFRENLSDQPRISNGVTIMVHPTRVYCLIQGNVYFTP